jgi:transcriptional regulator with XRE-family HTH domain
MGRPSGFRGLGRALRALREQCGESQKEVVEALNEEVSLGWLSAMENDRRMGGRLPAPSLKVVELLADHYGCPPERVFEMSEVISPLLGCTEMVRRFMQLYADLGFNCVDHLVEKGSYIEDGTIMRPGAGDDMPRSISELFRVAHGIDDIRDRLRDFMKRFDDPHKGVASFLVPNCNGLGAMMVGRVRLRETGRKTFLDHQVAWDFRIEGHKIKEIVLYANFQELDAYLARRDPFGPRHSRC